jgi:hypothetical protein
MAPQVPRVGGDPAKFAPQLLLVPMLSVLFWLAPLLFLPGLLFFVLAKSGWLIVLFVPLWFVESWPEEAMVLLLLLSVVAMCVLGLAVLSPL